MQMAILALSSLLIGSLLGMRFKVYILLPVTCLAFAVIVFIVFVRDYDLWWFAISAGLATVGLQFGYIVGSAIPIVLASKQVDEHSLERMSSNDAHGSWHGSGAR
jgi:hypothetical protein